METTITLAAGQEPAADPVKDLYNRIQKVCGGIEGTTSRRATFGNEMYVYPTANGYTCSFDRLVTRMPVLFEGLVIARVAFSSPHMSGLTLQPGMYRRKCAWGVVEGHARAPQGETPFVYYSINLEADGLSPLIRLYDDLMRGQARPRKVWPTPVAS